MSKRMQNEFEHKYPYLKAHEVHHDVHEWHGINLEEYRKSYITNKKLN